jgi:hypothetical protein
MQTLEIACASGDARDELHGEACVVAGVKAAWQSRGVSASAEPVNGARTCFVKFTNEIADNVAGW